MRALERALARRRLTGVRRPRPNIEAARVCFSTLDLRSRNFPSPSLARLERHFGGGEWSHLFRRPRTLFRPSRRCGNMRYSASSFTTGRGATAVMTNHAMYRIFIGHETSKRRTAARAPSNISRQAVSPAIGCSSGSDLSDTRRFERAETERMRRWGSSNPTLAVSCSIARVVAAE